MTWDGTAAHTLILGLQLTQFPGRKGPWNRKVARSAEKYCLTKVYAHLQLTTRRWRNERRAAHRQEKVLGRYRARTMNQKMEKWSHSFLKNSRRYTVERPPLHQHRLAPSSLDGRCQWCPVPLRVENSWKQSVTHTHTLIEMRTDLKALPHACLSKNHLRCQVQTPPNDFPQSDENPANLQAQTSSPKQMHDCRCKQVRWPEILVLATKGPTRK